MRYVQHRRFEVRQILIFGDAKLLFKLMKFSQALIVERLAG